jgi:hypothetical protein
MKKFIFTVLFLLVPGLVFAAGSSSEVTNDTGMKGDIRRVTVTWVADDTDGSVPDCTFSLGNPLQWYIFRAYTNPDGTTAPTDNYDIAINDEWGVDMANGDLADRDTANNERVQFTQYDPVLGNITVKISNNSVNSAAGVLDIVFVK